MARMLVGRVESARSPQAEVKALDNLLQADGVGVRSPRGRVEQHGTRHVYLYDFEVAALARLLRGGPAVRRLAARSNLTTDALAASLNADLSTLTTTHTLLVAPFTGKGIATNLAQAFRTAATHQTDPRYFTDLLLRSLAQRDGIDVTDPARIARGTFDPIASLLIRLDIARALFGHVRGKALLASADVPSPSGQLPIAQLSGCGGPDGEPAEVEEKGAPDAIGEKLAMAAIEKLEQKTLSHHLLHGVERVQGIFEIAKEVLDGAHGVVLAPFVVVVPLKDPAGRTAYGTVGHPGEPLEFQVRVVMTIDLPKILDCFSEVPLVGKGFPKAGGIPDVPVNWSASPEGSDLRDFGTVTCDAECSKTNEAGIATLKFQPKSELFTIGISKEETGVVSAQADYLSKFGNELGLVAEKIYPNTAAIRWFVSHHAQGYTIDATTPPVDPNPGDNGSYTQSTHLNIHLCDDGSGIARQQWTGTADYTQAGNPPDPQYYADYNYTLHADFQQSLTVNTPTDLSIDFQDPNDSTHNSTAALTVTLQGPRNPTATVVMHVTSGTSGAAKDSSITVPVQEYDGCP